MNEVHSQHSILSVILHPCFKLSFFEQQDLNEEPRSEADENKQIRFKSEALGILKRFYAEYAAKTPAYPTPAQKSKTVSEPVLYHPLQKRKITSNNKTDEILTYLRMPEPPWTNQYSNGGKKINHYFQHFQKLPKIIWLFLQHQLPVNGFFQRLEI